MEENKIEYEAVRALGRKEYSVWEIEQKLKKKFPESEEAIQSVLAQLKEKKWVSDERYCEVFIQNQKITTQAGPFLIHQKLKQKGVNDSIINQSLSEYFNEEEQKEMVRGLKKKKEQQKKRMQKKENSAWEAEQKIQQYILQKGYAFDIIQSALTEE